ncbi:MAG: MBL fold metallo-hydrolase [Bacteroidetes bacterium]|nr:MBL fold metallo-hydrolase [Bacteroidales bacterium]NJO69907.1 MBL fold metallo-hydrolase [Bacteroidota bacterium]
MKITVLTENTAGRNCLAEFGLSYFIEADKKILFDTGSTDVFRVNADRIGISPDEADMIVLSHGHWDHGNGLKYIENKPLLTHPGSFRKRYSNKDNRYVGLDMSIESAKEKFELITSRIPFEISPEITFLGEIPRLNNFESQQTYFYFDDKSDDFVSDDSAIVVKTNKGLVVISGCAHAGICNTIDYACKVTGTEKVFAVIGGFHLKGDNEVTHKTIQYMKQKNIEQVYPSHCTALPALVGFSREYKIYQVLTGDIFYF